MPLNINRMTVIVEDGFVSINNVGYLGLDCSSAPSDIRAMQWYGTVGEEEMAYVPPNPPAPNREIFNLDAYQTIIANWEVANTPVVTQPTATEITTETLRRASGNLSVAAYYFIPGVWDDITLNSQQDLQTWVSVVTTILANAQKILVSGTGESYSPEFPPAPTLNPSAIGGATFTVYFK